MVSKCNHASPRHAIFSGAPRDDERLVANNFSRLTMKWLFFSVILIVGVVNRHYLGQLDQPSVKYDSARLEREKQLALFDASHPLERVDADSLMPIHVSEIPPYYLAAVFHAAQPSPMKHLAMLDNLDEKPATAVYQSVLMDRVIVIPKHITP